MNSDRSKSHRIVRGKPFGVLIFLLLAPILLIYATLYALAGLVVHLAICLLWCTRGRTVLFVYSDSTISREYVEREILPEIRSRAVVLNWSGRKQWRMSLAVIVFRRLTDGRAFVPIAIVFRPFRIAKIFRFFKPFQDYKRGDRSKVDRMKAELFEAIRR